MEYCVLNGFLMVLLIQHSTAEDLPTSIHSSSLPLQEGQTLPQEQELPPAEVVPVVAPPSLEEVHQAVQEASEQVEGRGAEEVLKELLERVVEAALGQAEGGGEPKAEESLQHETVETEALGVVKDEAETDSRAEVSVQAGEETDEETGPKEGETGVVEEQAVAEVDTLVDVAEEGENVVGEAESVEEFTKGVETGGSETEEVKATDGSPDTEVNHEVVEESVSAFEKTDGYSVDDSGMQDKKEQVLLLEEKGAAEAETQVAEEPPAVVEAAVSEQETLIGSDSSLEQTEDVEAEEAAPEEETQVDVMERDMLVPASDNYKVETTQTVVGEQAEEEQEVNVVEDTVGPEVENEQRHLVVEEEVTEEITKEDEKTEDFETQKVSITEESVSVSEGAGEQKAGEEEQIALEDSHGKDNNKQEVLVISAPEPEDGADVSIENSPVNQTPTQSPYQGEVETAENTPSDETSNHGNEIITPTDVALPNEHVVAEPTLDNFVKNVEAVAPQAEVEELGEANEQVEDAGGSTDMSELGLEAWKIGAISAAVFLVLETVIIIFYILKCRNKNSAPSVQRACEEGCVEPEAATGGDCSDDTLPAGNGDTQQIISLDVSSEASTLAQNKEKQEAEHATAMSNLLPGSTGADSSQDLRTSTL